MIATRESRFGRFRFEAESANEAWGDFYRHDWAALLRQVQAMGLRPHQAEEAVQEAIVVLLRECPAFAPDRRRGRVWHFLLTTVRRKATAIQRQARQACEVPWESAIEASRIASDVPGSPDADPARWRDALCEAALGRLRDDPGVARTTFAIFHAYVVERRDANEVARSFGVNENGVYQIKNRLLRRLRRDVAAMMRKGDMA